LPGDGGRECLQLVLATAKIKYTTKISESYQNRIKTVSKTFDILLPVTAQGTSSCFREWCSRVKSQYGSVNEEETRFCGKHLVSGSSLEKARYLFRYAGRLYAPFEDLSDTITETGLNIEDLLRRYEEYLRENRDWLLRDVPRRVSDLRIYEAIYHFNLYRYLASFLEDYGGRVVPEFPTGNGKVDLLIEYAGRQYAVEVKSYANLPAYKAALRQAARYGQQLGLEKITLALFVEAMDETNRARYEVVYEDEETGVTVTPVFVATGE